MMIPIGKLLLSVFSFTIAFALWKLLQFTYHQRTSPLRHLRGPKPTSLIYGNLRELWNSDRTEVHERWVKEYGSTMGYRELFFNTLFTMDLRAINHILTHSDDYHKPYGVRYLLSHILGAGLLVVEGAKHRQQRHVMNPAFGPAQIRALTDIFLAKATQLRDIWSSELAKDGSTTGTRIDVMPWLSKMTLDIIGLAGFNYNFDALNENGKPNELNQALSAAIASARRSSILPLLRAWIPPLRLIPNDTGRKLKVARQTTTRIGNELLAEAKSLARASATEKGEVESSNMRGRDLLSLLVKANMATDIPESQKMSDEDVLAQVPTFLIAGHETTSTATTWALYAMTQAPHVQTKLRDELLSLNTDTPSMDDLMSLPYLDAVVRETLRVHSPVLNSARVAMRDDVIPVDKPFEDRYGKVRNEIRIRKGDMIYVPVLEVNRSEELWGADAHEFRPERWENVPEGVSHIPGVWGHLMSFLGGPKACIGYRFSIVEMKAILFTLVRAFEFELAVPVSQVGRKATMVQRPVLRSEPNRPQLPLLVRSWRT